MGIYNLFAVLAAILASGIFYVEFKKHEINTIHAFILPFSFLLISRLGAHLLYCYEHGFWFDSLLLYVSLNKGGMSLYGGLFLCVIFAAFYGKIIGVASCKFLDILSPGTAFALAIGRMGCFFAGCCRGFRLPDNMTLPGFVTKPQYFPTPIVAVLANLVIAFILFRKPLESNMYGKRFALFIMLYGISRFLIGFLRANKIVFMDLNMMQILSIALIATGFILILLIEAKSKRCCINAENLMYPDKSI